MMSPEIALAEIESATNRFQTTSSRTIGREVSLKPNYDTNGQSKAIFPEMSEAKLSDQ